VRIFRFYKPSKKIAFFGENKEKEKTKKKKKEKEEVKKNELPPFCDDPLPLISPRLVMEEEFSVLPFLARLKTIGVDVPTSFVLSSGKLLVTEDGSYVKKAPGPALIVFDGRYSITEFMYESGKDGSRSAVDLCLKKTTKKPFRLEACLNVLGLEGDLSELEFHQQHAAAQPVTFHVGFTNCAVTFLNKTFDGFDISISLLVKHWKAELKYGGAVIEWDSGKQLLSCSSLKVPLSTILEAVNVNISAVSSSEIVIKEFKWCDGSIQACVVFWEFEKLASALQYLEKLVKLDGSIEFTYDAQEPQKSTLVIGGVVTLSRWESGLPREIGFNLDEEALRDGLIAKVLMLLQKVLSCDLEGLDFNIRERCLIFGLECVELKFLKQLSFKDLRVVIPMSSVEGKEQDLKVGCALFSFFWFSKFL
jgi:hypothetical protein